MTDEHRDLQAMPDRFDPLLAAAQQPDAVKAARAERAAYTRHRKQAQQAAAEAAEAAEPHQLAGEAEGETDARRDYEV